MTRQSGSCLCGAVRVSAEIGPRKIAACHCGQCRTWTGGGPYYSTSVVDPVIEGEEHIGIFVASEWGERGFCKTCGTTLFWKMKGRPVHNLAAGLFDDQSDLAVTTEIFCDRRAEWQTPFPGAKQSTEAQEQALLADYLAAQKGDQP
ncbi:MAG: GFA family protein [Pseudomonadota bacterium]